MPMLVVSNRLPLALENADGGWRSRPTSGGLVTALVSVLRKWGGQWVGSPATSDIPEEELQRALAESSLVQGYDLAAVTLTAEEQRGFYEGFTNRIIWPLFHDLQSLCNFDPDYWTSYVAVNTKFADVVSRRARGGDFVWVHDYHLMSLGRRLRALSLKNRLGFFLHIPFPPPDIFAKLPWRAEVLEDLLMYDVVGFQTARDVENFGDCVRRLLPEVRRRRVRTLLRLSQGEHACMVGAFPIGIDFHEFSQAAAAPATEERVQELRQDMQGQQIILGVDRLDYTKGLRYRLRAFQLALRRYPELHRKTTLLQLVVPSRETVPEYQELKAQVEQLVSQINGEFTRPGWVPIHYVFRSVSRDELVAYYSMSDVALVTPLKDGMNLVAKEYCACQIDGDGVLILSEFAGAAAQLGRGAVLVNPYDLDRVADAIRRAVLMTPRQRGPAMRRLRDNVQRFDVHYWVSEFLSVCGLPSAAPAGPISLHAVDQRPAEASPA